MMSKYGCRVPEECRSNGNLARIPDHSQMPFVVLQRWLLSRKSEMYAVYAKANGLVQNLPRPLIHPLVKADWNLTEVPGYYWGSCWRTEDSDRQLTLREG